MKRLLRFILSRTTFILLLLLAQIAFFFVTINFLAQYQYVHTALYIITVIIIAYLIYKEENPIYKLTWIIPILIFPLFGGLFYLFYKNTNISKKSNPTIRYNWNWSDGFHSKKIVKYLTIKYLIIYTKLVGQPIKIQRQLLW